MKSFKLVYNQQKSTAIAEQRSNIEKDHARLVEAIKKEYVINDFSQLNESDRESYRAMINAMWDKDNGLNEKGVAFINESVSVLTEKSTDEQIEKYVKREIKANCQEICKCLAAGGECSFLVNLKKNVEDSTKKKLSAKNVKQWIYEICVKYMADKIKGLKF
jgi:hypothetical protein